MRGLKATQSWLRAENIEFISKEEWPPSSPDLNPLYYSVWVHYKQGPVRSLTRV